MIPKIVTVSRGGVTDEIYYSSPVDWYHLDWDELDLPEVKDILKNCGSFLPRVIVSELEAFILNWDGGEDD